jgi:arsenate reductase (thioredoxin)
MPDSVLFLCPHGAAKSVLAAALFARLAEAQGLPLRGTCAGTEPDPQLAPHVRALLEREGLAIPLERPQLVTEALVEAAAWVISLGCARDELPRSPHRWEQWDDVPLPSQDLQGAYHCIEQHLAAWSARLKTDEPERGALNAQSAPAPAHLGEGRGDDN